MWLLTISPLVLQAIHGRWGWDMALLLAFLVGILAFSVTIIGMAAQSDM